MIEQGIPCCGVTTGLGKLVTTELDPLALQGRSAGPDVETLLEHFRSSEFVELMRAIRSKSA
ncbi:MAG: hypothetical protein ACI9LO_001170 [Planctomycetota bacterium]|jgi:hypothetical protein